MSNNNNEEEDNQQEKNEDDFVLYTLEGDEKDKYKDIKSIKSSKKSGYFDFMEELKDDIRHGRTKIDVLSIEEEKKYNQIIDDGLQSKKIKNYNIFRENIDINPTIYSPFDEEEDKCSIFSTLPFHSSLCNRLINNNQLKMFVRWAQSIKNNTKNRKFNLNSLIQSCINKGARLINVVKKPNIKNNIEYISFTMKFNFNNYNKTELKKLENTYIDEENYQTDDDIDGFITDYLEFLLDFVFYDYFQNLFFKKKSYKNKSDLDNANIIDMKNIQNNDLFVFVTDCKFNI